MTNANSSSSSDSSSVLNQQQIDAYIAQHPDEYAVYLQHLADTGATDTTNDQPTTGTGQLEKSGFFVWNAVNRFGNLISSPVAGSTRSIASKAYSQAFGRYSLIRAGALSVKEINSLANNDLSAENKFHTIMSLSAQVSIAGIFGLVELKAHIAQTKKMQDAIAAGLNNAVDTGTEFLDEFSLNSVHETYLEQGINRAQLDVLGSEGHLVDADFVNSLQTLDSDFQAYRTSKQNLQNRLDELAALDVSDASMNSRIKALIEGSPVGGVGDVNAQKSLEALKQELSRSTDALSRQYDAHIDAIKNTPNASTATTELLDNLPSDMDVITPQLSNNRSATAVSDFRLDSDYQDYLNASLNSARNDVPNLSDELVKQSFGRLDNAVQNHSITQTDLDVRLQALDDFDAGRPINGISADAASSLTRSDIINGTGSFQGASIETLKNDFALSSAELDAAYGHHMHRVSLTTESASSSINDIMDLPPADLDVANPSLKRQSSTTLANIDFDLPSVPKQYDLVSTISKISKVDLAINGLAIGAYAATLVTSALSLHNAINAEYDNKKQKQLTIATAALYTAGGAIGTLSAVLDVISLFAKGSKALGPVAMIIGTVADIILAVGDTVAVFNNPNATPRDKVLSVANIFTPMLDLMAIGDAVELQNRLKDPSLSNADRWALESLYEVTVMNAIPILNCFSFAWSNEKYALAAGKIIAYYGDNNDGGAGGVLTDAMMSEFLDDTLEGLVQSYYQENFGELKNQLTTWYDTIGAQQLVSIGYGASFSRLSADAQGIYQQIIPERLRQDDSNIISKITVSIADESLLDSELISRHYGQVYTDQTYQGNQVIKHKAINWRLGAEDAEVQEGVTTNVALIQYAQSFAGDTWVYDDQAIDNTVFYESAGDRNMGFYQQWHSGTETYYEDETYTVFAGAGNWYERTRTVAKTREVEWYTHVAIAGENTDHINLGLGHDSVVIGSQHEHISISSDDWLDPFTATSVDDALTLAIATTQLDVQLSASMDDAHRVRLVWQGMDDAEDATVSEDHRIDLANIESVRFNDAAGDTGALIFSDSGSADAASNDTSFTLYVDDNATALTISDQTDGNVYNSGRILAGDDDDELSIDTRTHQLDVNTGAGDDVINLPLSINSESNAGSQQVVVDGGEGDDTLNSGHESIIIGADASVYDELLQDGHLLVNNIEHINGKGNTQDYLYVSGDVTIRDGRGNDSYEALLDEGEGVLDVTLSNNGALTIAVAQLQDLTFADTLDANIIEVSYQGEVRLRFNKSNLRELNIRHGEDGREDGVITIDPSNLQLVVDSSSASDLLNNNSSANDDVIYLTERSVAQANFYGSIQGQAGDDTLVLANGYTLQDNLLDLFDLGTSTLVQLGQGQENYAGSTLVNEVENFYFVADDISVRLSEYNQVVRAENTQLLSSERSFVVAGAMSRIDAQGDMRGEGNVGHGIYFSQQGLEQGSTTLSNTHSSDEIFLSGQYSIHDITFERSGDSMLVTLGQIGAADSTASSEPHQIIISDWFVDGATPPTIKLGNHHSVTPIEAEALAGLQGLLEQSLDTINADNATTFAVQFANSREQLWQSEEFGIIKEGLTINQEGNNQYLYATDGLSGFNGLTEFTYEVSFRMDADNHTSVLTSYATEGNSNEFLIASESGELNIYLGRNSHRVNLTADELNDDKDHSISVSWVSETGSLDVYIDGQLRGSTEGFAQGYQLPDSTNGQLNFGQEQDKIAGGFVPYEFFAGTYYSARLFDQVKTQEDIAQGHLSNVSLNDASLVSGWNFADFELGVVQNLLGDSSNVDGSDLRTDIVRNQIFDQADAVTISTSDVQDLIQAMAGLVNNGGIMNISERTGVEAMYASWDLPR